MTTIRWARSTWLTICLVIGAGFAVPVVMAAYSFTANGIELSRTSSLQGDVPYDYAPSVMVEGTTTKMWWCGGELQPSPPADPGQVYDVVYYATKVGSDPWSTPVKVLNGGGAGTWDTTHSCDPSVIKGSWSVGGTTYAYALYYTASDLSGQAAKIGVAFSNDGVSWTKYSGNPILSPSMGIYEYGVGLDSAYSTGGSNVTMVYFDSTKNNQAMVLTSTDGINFNASTPYRLPFSGLDTFADIAYSTSESRWYLATKNQIDLSYDGTPHNDHETYVFRSNGSTLATQVWTFVGTIGTNLTGYRLNHNAGWYRTTTGDLYESGSARYIVYGAQTSDPNNADNPSLWDIGKTTITGSFDSVSAPGSFTLTGPTSGATIDPLATDVFTWSSSANATSYVITISESSSLNPSDSGNATPIISTVHATSYEGLKTVYNTGPITNRQALRPNQTYYWSVRAVNSAGSTLATNGPLTFTTTDSYRWSFDEGKPRYWYTKLDSQTNATPLAPAGGRATISIVGLNDSRNQARLGGDYNPIRAELDTKTKIVLRMKNGTSATSLRVYYKLQDDPYLDAFRTKDFAIVPNDLYFREYALDMTGQTGWGSTGKRLAWLKLEPLSVSSGQYELDDMQIVGPGFTRTSVLGNLLRVGSSATSTYSNAYPSSNATDGHDGTFWISAGHGSASFTESITVDGGKSETITAVSFTPRPDGEGVPEDFTIAVSPDQSIWTTVVTQTSYPVVTSKQTFTLGTPVVARYVRFQATKLRANGGGQYLLELAEVAGTRDTSKFASTSNAGFEDGLANWGLWSSGVDNSVDTLQTYGTGTLSGIDGSNSYAAVFDAAGNVSGSFYRTVGGLTAGGTYKVMVWAASSGREARLVVRNYGGSEVYQSTTSSAWTLLTQTVTLGATNTSLEVHLYGPENGVAYSYASFDNVEVVKQ